MVVIFDFDGTIVNTITDVVISFNDALRLYGFPEYTVESFNRFVGGDLETIVSGLIPKEFSTRENIDNVKKAYRKFYMESSKPNSKPYDGIMDLLQQLKLDGVKLAVNSNKGQALLDDMVEKIFPDNLFDSVVGYLETRPSKPDAFGVNMIAKECCESVDGAIYVGDGISDVLTAKNAGIPCIFCQWGQGQLDHEIYKNVVNVQTVNDLKKELYRFKGE